MIESFISANQIIGAIVYRTREALNNNDNFMNALVESPFGRNYIINGKFNVTHMPGTISEIKNNLLQMTKTQAMQQYKYPSVFNYEQKTYSTLAGYTTININLSFVAITDKNYLTEEREKYVFDPVLRPIFREFFQQVLKARFLKRPVTIDIPQWIEIFTTGNYDESQFVEYGDWLDAIEVRNYQLVYKDCNSSYNDEILNDYNNLIQI